jgi:soluble lytic murein transglycosylase-like protein
MTTEQIKAAVSASAVSHGVDPALALAVAQTESNYNPSAVSGAGAVGVFQLMPGTAAGLGVVNSFDPLQNIEGGVTYLGSLLSQFGGDVSLALAAYNAGPGNVAKYGGIPPFPETQNYVAKILASLGFGTGTVDASVWNDGETGAAVISTAGLVAVGITAAALGWLLIR